MATYESVHSHDDGPIQHTETPGRVHQSKSRPHWKAPAAMIGGLIGALVFAIIHHFFYRSFNHQQVGSSLQQKVIITAGTAFAFLVKMFLTFAVGVVFTQQLFKSLRQRAEKVEDIDSLFGVLENALHLAKISLWFRHFTLGLIAAVVWTISIPSVFTPGTINVHPALKYDNNTLLRPAQPQQTWINKQNWASTQIDYSAMFRVGSQTWAGLILNGPSGTLLSVGIGSAGSKEILPIPPPSQNSSYPLEFYAPALSCNEVSSADMDTFHKAYSHAAQEQWLPQLNSNLGAIENAFNSSSFKLLYNAWVNDSIFDIGLANPSWNNDSAIDASNTPPSSDNTEYFYFAPGAEEFLISCHLHNATYNVQFDFENSNQKIQVNSVHLHEPVPYNGTIDTTTPDYGNAVYTAVLFAFNKIVIAAAANETSAGATDQGVLYYNNPVSISILKDFIEGNTPSTAPALINALETMFQNITLSTMSAPDLRLPADEAKQIRGSTWHTTNVYIYSPETLYIAYGVALLIGLLCVLWGFRLLFDQGHVSFSTKFSTFLRTTRRKELNSIISIDASRGNDPVPRKIGETKLVLGSHDGLGEEDGFRLAQDNYTDESWHKKQASVDEDAEELTYQPQIPSASDSTNTGSVSRMGRKPLPQRRVNEIVN